MTKRYRQLLILTLLASSGLAVASGPEFRGLNFKPALPTQGCSLEASVTNPDTLVADMEHNLKLVLQFPALTYEIVGTTDDEECDGVACAVLSADRARLVEAWLVRNGAPQNKLLIVGKGKLFPPDYKSRPRDRFIARSVYIQPVLDGPN